VTSFDSDSPPPVKAVAAALRDSDDEGPPDSDGNREADEDDYDSPVAQPAAAPVFRLADEDYSD
jgi:hypothetical protein